MARRTSLRHPASHLDYAVDVAVLVRQACGIEAELSRHRRANLLYVEYFTLDSAARHDTSGHGTYCQLLPSLEAERLKTAKMKDLAIPELQLARAPHVPSSSRKAASPDVGGCRFSSSPAYISAVILFDCALQATSSTLCARRLYDGVFSQLRDHA